MRPFGPAGASLPYVDSAGSPVQGRGHSGPDSRVRDDVAVFTKAEASSILAGTSAASVVMLYWQNVRHVRQPDSRRMHVGMFRG